MTESRCEWCTDNDLMRAYHDTEWGVPLRDDQKLFEFLILEGAQSGLSWQLIMNRREGYRAAYEGFDPERVAGYGAADTARLMGDPGIIRNAAKVAASITNARAFLEIQSERGSFANYLWTFVDGAPIQNSWSRVDEVPVQTPLSERIAGDLKARGFRFVGPIVIYSHMQATGMVNDHLTDCFRHAEVRGYT